MATSSSFMSWLCALVAANNAAEAGLRSKKITRRSACSRSAWSCSSAMLVRMVVWSVKAQRLGLL